MAETWAALLALAVAAAALAGCSDAGGTDSVVNLGDGSQVELKDVTAEEGKGGISGVVVDEAIRPLPAVNLTVSGQPELVTTDANGLFVVEGLEPGLYTLSASHEGYLPIQTTAEVVPGETAKVRMVLAVDPAPKPYHTTLAFEWYDEAGQGLVDFAADLFLRDTGLVPPLCDVCYFPFTADGPVEAFTIEATWEDSVPDPVKQTEYYWTLDNLGEEGGYASDYFDNPGHAVVDGNPFAESVDFAFGLASEEEWVTFQQTAQIFVTLWYLGPPPEGWSFIAGDR